MNSSILNDKENIRELHSTIQNAVCQGDSFDAISLWELAKVMIRSKCIGISRKKAKNNTNLEKVLLKKIDVVTNELPKSIDTEDQLVTLQKN